MVVEVRPPGFGKGWCVESIGRDRELVSMVYFGDDRTDAEAFEAIDRWRSAELGRHGVTVAVENAEAPPSVLNRADFTVESVAAVAELLLDLASRVETAGLPGR